MEKILINIVDNMEKRLIFADEYHIIRYLNNAAKSHFSKKNYKNLNGKSVLKFHDEETKEKIKMAVNVLKSNNSLYKVTIGDTNIYAVRINNVFRGYYEIF